MEGAGGGEKEGAVRVIQGFWFSELTGGAKWMSGKGGTLSLATALRKLIYGS